MTTVLQSAYINVSKDNQGHLLLKVNFQTLQDQDGEEYSWMPQWETIRELVFSAMTVEAFNTPGGRELTLFRECLELCLKSSNKISDMLKGIMCIEDKQLKKIIQELVSSGL